MGAPNYLMSSLESSGKQVQAVFAGVTGDQWDHKVLPVSMSPRETAEHLAHCYTAFMTEAQGGSWDWTAPFSLGLDDPEALLAKANSLREEAVNYTRNSEDEKVFGLANDFLVNHDGYHVGQMATYRMSTDPTWDPYSIYS